LPYIFPASDCLFYETYLNTGVSVRPGRRGVLQRLRPLLIVCAATLVALALGVAFGARALIGSFNQVESAATAQKAMQVYRAFEADLRQLMISNRDYAEWDDAEAYVRTEDAGFIERNFSADTLAAMYVDLIWIAPLEGPEKYSAYLDRRSSTIESPASEQILAPFRTLLPKFKELARLSPAERIVMTPQGLAAVSAIEIRRSDKSSRTGVIMMFARYIKDADIARVRDTSHLPVSLISLADKTAALPDSVRKWSATQKSGGKTLVISPSDAETTGYALVSAYNETPLAIFSTRAPREILALGHRVTWYMLGAISVLFLAFSSAVFALILRLQKSFAQREAEQQRYELIGNQLREAIVLIDAQSHEIVDANGTAIRALGGDRADLPTRKVQDLFPDITQAVLEEAALPDSGRKVIATRLRRWNGAWNDAEISITAMDDSGRRLLTLVGHDITHRKEAAAQEHANRRKLLQLAQHDALTGLPNRLYLHARLPQVLEKIANSERLLALMYVDVDHFKNINDSRGHACGDQLLQIVAKRLRAAVSMQDLVARMGGDEFVVVASLMSNREAIDALATRLQTAVNAAILINDETLSVTASIGIAVYPEDGLQIDALLKNADIALYQAKDAGRKCHRFFMADMDVRVSEHVALEQALRHATGTPQIFLEYQPIVDLNTGRVASLEALMRWRHPDRGLIPPSRFIPVAEQSGLIEGLGHEALREVVAQLRRWLDAGVPIVPIAVNVSPVPLERVDFAAQVAQLSKDQDVDPKWLRFEITESAVMKEPEKLIATLQTLRDLGSYILIDDFGTGYSSLSYLNRLPVDVLKIDRAFVRDIGSGGEKKPIINAVIDLARKLNLFTVAEGVESEEQARLLRAEGCDYAQGYHFSKPVSADQCRLLLEKLNCEKPLTETLVMRVTSEATPLRAGQAAAS
jgi:diguanylate cyclase (GGDEF)-like protein/PAS domain S-box-containing protein